MVITFKNLRSTKRESKQIGCANALQLELCSFISEFYSYTLYAGLLKYFFILFTILRTKLLHRVAHSECIFGLGQTSLFSCAEPNVNEEKSLF